MRRIISTLLVSVSLTALLAGNALAQINYDAVNHAYFVVGDATINTNILGNDVFVGKDNATNFATLPGPITLTIAEGALISYHGNIYAGAPYNSVNVFGTNIANMTGGRLYSGLRARDASIVNVSGGSVESVSSWDNSTVNVSGGNITGGHGEGNGTINFFGGNITTGFNLYHASTLNVISGWVQHSIGYNTGTINISGGHIANPFLYDASTLNMTGGSVGYTILGGSSSAVIRGGALSNSASLIDASQMTFHGSGMSVSSSNTSLWNGTANYRMTRHNLTGTLENGDPLTTSILAGETFTGDETQLVFTGAPIADDIFLTEDATINSVVNTVTVGRDAAATLNTSPTVAINLNASTGHVPVYNGSTVNVNGGVIHGTVTLNDVSTINLNNGTVFHINSYGDSTVNINGGRVSENARFRDASTANITGGTLQRMLATDASTADISGGIVHDAGVTSDARVIIRGGEVYNTTVQANAVLNIRGGSVDNLQVRNEGTVNITGGNVATATSGTHSRINIGGGNVNRITIGMDWPSYKDTLNLSGGSVGGVGGNSGIYALDGTVNLYGSGFTRTNIVAGTVLDVHGTFSTLTGTLLDGTALNTTLFLSNHIAYADRGGATQDDPVLPDTSENGIFTFINVPSGAWFDPPFVDRFLFTMTDGNTFTDILDFPTGFDSAFDVRVGDLLLGSFSSGQSVHFADFGFADGVNSFLISGITPPADVENPFAFPIKLGFSAPFASFSMGLRSNVGAPEPGTVGFVVIGGICGILAGGSAARRRG